MSLSVALVCPYSLDVPGGVGTHVLGLARWLAGRGHAPIVIAPGTAPAAGVEGVTVELLGSSTPLRFNGSVANLALSPAQSRRAVALAAAADVVHVHEPLTPGIAFAAARAARALVVTHHASYRPHGPLRGALRLRAAGLGSRVSIAVSEAAAGTARAVTGVAPTVVPNAITLPPPPAPRTGWRGGSRARVGFLGRLDEPRKGFGVFRDLARRCAAGGFEAEFVAAGPGAAEAGPVRRVGGLSDTERSEFLAGLDVLVAPNLRGESFGLVIVEALAAGADVVVSDLPGFTDVLARADVGATFETGSAAAAERVLRDRLRRPLDPLAAHAAASQWGWERVGPMLESRYERLAPMA